MHDLVIRGGKVVDGTGAAPVTADIAIDGDQIVAVGQVDQAGTREIEADGALVTPGWVDVHTHYDGQATWDPVMRPSIDHGVTTAVMGNCGVGFAPVRPGGEAFLIELMEAIEDIPGTALHEGIDWRWETFGEYIDALAECRAPSIWARPFRTRRCGPMCSATGATSTTSTPPRSARSPA
jgi:N-acyl-D-aspartate/D-glutamate deacylase